MNFSSQRYDNMQYRRCGRSGLHLPALSLGLWHNFGTKANHENCRNMLRAAFDNGITHFDLGNNYGPLPGSAEERMGRILRDDFTAHRDELIISTKAGHEMWPGPYGNWGSKKYLVASLDQSLMRMGLDYVDIFYHHRPDPETPLEETLGALDLIVRQGKALYTGISNYRGLRFIQAVETVKRRNWAPLTIHQPRYNMLDRWIEDDLLIHTGRYGAGVIVFSPLGEGLLTSKYADPKKPLPNDSRAAAPEGHLQPEALTQDRLGRIRQLEIMAKARGQSVAQLSLAWVLRDPRVTSALIGARNPEQIQDSVGALQNLEFSPKELSTIDKLFPPGQWAANVAPAKAAIKQTENKDMTKDVIIYHNPRCSTSRKAMQLLKEKGVEPKVVQYLEEPLSATQIKRVLAKLDTPPHSLLRAKEAPYSALGLSPKSTKKDIVAAIAEHPILFQRPVVEVGDKAVIARPTEKILELL